MEWETDLENCFTDKAVCMRVNGRTIWCMGKENFITQAEM